MCIWTSVEPPLPPGVTRGPEGPRAGTGRPCSRQSTAYSPRALGQASSALDPMCHGGSTVPTSHAVTGVREEDQQVRVREAAMQPGPQRWKAGGRGAAATGLGKWQEGALGLRVSSSRTPQKWGREERPITVAGPRDLAQPPHLLILLSVSLMWGNFSRKVSFMSFLRSEGFTYSITVVCVQKAAGWGPALHSSGPPLRALGATSCWPGLQV